MIIYLQKKVFHGDAQNLHRLIFKEIIFSSRNPLKIAGTAENRRKTGFFHFSSYIWQIFMIYLHSEAK